VPLKELINKIEKFDNLIKKIQIQSEPYDSSFSNTSNTHSNPEIKDLEFPHTEKKLNDLLLKKS